MKIVFFGTSDFAVPSLKRLSKAKHEVLLAVTQPDRKKGRHLQVAASPVKIEAQKLNIPVHQTENLLSLDSVNMLKKAGAGLFVVVSFGQILKKEILEIPEQFSINLHASLLPKYRGAAPMNWAIINGEERTGVSVIKMNEKMDAGAVLLDQEVKILPDDTTLTLGEKLSEMGAELLLRAVNLIESGEAKVTKQDEASVSYAPKLKKEDGQINWERHAFQIHDLVRGLIPWPSAFTLWKGKTLKIWKTSIDTRDLDSQPGQVVLLSDEGILVKTTKANLVIKELQLEGGKKMDSSSFLRGHKIKVGDKLG